MIAIVGLIVSVFAGGQRRDGGTPSSANPASSAQAVPAAARESCADFDQATGRLATNDNKGFIEAMTIASSAAQQAAASDRHWQSLELGFAAFATDLTAHDSVKVFTDLNALNEICAAVRGARSLNLNGR